MCLPVADSKVLSATVEPDNNNTNPTPTTTIERAVTPPIQQEPAISLISPPATPRQTSLRPQAVIMNRSPLHGAPVRGQAPPPRGPARGNQPSFGTQDARSNLAVQPSTNAGSFKLKKNAVKIVGAAAPAPPPNTPFRAAAPAPATTSAVGSSPAPGPVKAKPKEARQYVVLPRACSDSASCRQVACTALELDYIMLGLDLI